MKLKSLILITALLIGFSATAQNNQDLSGNEVNVKLASKRARPLAPDAMTREFLYSISPENPLQLENPTIVTLNNDPSQLPDYGKRHMFLFYVDPESYVTESANRALEKELKADGAKLWEGRTYSPQIQGYAVLNLADTKLPPWLIR